MKKNTNKFMILFSSVFLFIGLGLLAGAVFWTYSASMFKKQAVEIPAEIAAIEAYRNSDGDISHQVYVNYEYDGKQYKMVALNSYSSSMYEGKEITLYCDPEHPGKIQEKSLFYMGPIILMIMGIIFTAVGAGMIIGFLRRPLLERKLKKNSMVLYATVTDIKYDTSFTVNGENPFVIYCNWKDEYKDITYRFKSKGIWSDPSFYFPVGGTIPVRVNPKDYSQYMVDVEDMEKRIVDYT